MLEDAIFTHLVADPTVASLVVERVYPLMAPEPPTYPYIAYSVVSQTRYSAMGADISPRRRRVQVDCYDETATGARTLAAAVENAMVRFMGTVTWSGGNLTIEDVYQIGLTDNFDFQARKFKRAVDLDIVFDG